MEARIQAEYTVVDSAKTLWEMLASAYKSMLKLDIFEIREDFWSIKLQDCGDVDKYASRINRKIKEYNLCTGQRVTLTAGTDAADAETDVNSKTIAKMHEQEHLFYLLCGIPTNDEWKIFLELMMDKNGRMTTTPEEIVTKLVEKQAAIRRENGLAPEALLLQRRVPMVVVMAVKPVKAAEVQRGIRDIIRETTIGKRRICGRASIASS